MSAARRPAGRSPPRRRSAHREAPCPGPDRVAALRALLALGLALLWALLAGRAAAAAEEPGGPGTSPAAASIDCREVRVLPRAERSAWQGGRLLERAEVVLPDRLPLAWRNERVQLRYRLALGPCGARPDTVLWLYRVGGPYRLRIDGAVLLPTLPPIDAAWQGPAAASAVLNGRTPSLFALPDGAREVTLELQTLPYLSAGVVEARLGPAARLVPSHVASFERLPGINDRVAAVALLAGVGVLGLWALRRRDRHLLWFALACLAWGLRGSFYADTPLLLPPRVFEQMVPLLTMLASVALAGATLAWLGRLDARRARIGVALLLVGLAAFVLAESAGRGAPFARVYGFGCGFVLMPWLMGQLWSARSRLGPWRTALMLLAYGLALAGAVHDIGMVLGFSPPGGMTWLLPGFAAMLVCTAGLMAEYALRQLDRAERGNEELERRVAEKSRSLEAGWAERREHERAAERTQERERLLREMHDGLGGQLMTVLRGVERGAMPREQVLESLQDSLDDLRLLMDSADVDRPLPQALGAWRSRWEPRLSCMDIALDWEVDDALDAVTLPPGTTLHLMRTVQEATVNVVKHAQARRVQLSAGRADDGGLWLEVTDDGVGLPAVPAGGRGLANMAARARQIGARLVVGPGPGGRGTAVRLQLPPSPGP
ncbi:sensor histidine kinase [Piscinibacter sakaiensis]|uniref:Histidine kinase/HSP90-like ATPase domain-containing protein n=1 Tax=Piscinibacter sakaiensis TaxID=1547922 RepID=A0A0K8P0D2_PISS1|nr:ATP-binding protein [Piscinibacter sakaiensis]GAP36091.1 hypothetical protein ISF6_1931 [Piscinibacter sakaiensis]